MPSKNQKSRFESVFAHEVKDRNSVSYFSKIQEDGEDLLDEAINSELAYIIVERLNKLWNELEKLKTENKAYHEALHKRVEERRKA